jgi:predicted RNA binding protein YcfA (HicA-like mRNA interferase family)
MRLRRWGMPRDRRDVEAGLAAKGFQQRDGDHRFFIYHTLQGRKSQVFTKTSHHDKQVDDGLLSQMSKQCRLSKKLFGELLDCPLDRESYEAELRKLGILV